MSSSLNRPVLVLNKIWAAIFIETLRQVLPKIFKNAALIVDYHDFNTYTWDQWYELEPNNDELVIKTTRKDVRVPRLVVLRAYNKIPVFDVKLTRKNLLVRDKFKCAYTGKTLRYKDATVDHVVPRCRGGVNAWGNVVIASSEANRKKGNKTPEEAGMLLHQTPFKPRWNPLYASAFARNTSNPDETLLRLIKMFR
tara:strand:+ start:1050 stop:1637 length:588 start_codon:yes stop_codon:yes gene_type:complete